MGSNNFPNFMLFFLMWTYSNWSFSTGKYVLTCKYCLALFLCSAAGCQIFGALYYSCVPTVVWICFWFYLKSQKASVKNCSFLKLPQGLGWKWGIWGLWHKDVFKLSMFTCSVPRTYCFIAFSIKNEFIPWWYKAYIQRWTMCQSLF